MHQETEFIPSDGRRHGWKTDYRERTSPWILLGVLVTALAIFFALFSFMGCTRAHAFDEHDWQANIDNRSENTSDDWNKEWLGGDKFPHFDLFDGGSYMPTIVYNLIYKTIEGFAGWCTNASNKLIEQLETNKGWTLQLDDTTYFGGVFSAVRQISETIIQPIAIGFLGLALVLSLLNFSKEVAQNHGDHFGMAGSYLWIVVKYALIMTLIDHTMLVCQGVYSIFLWITQKILDLLAATPISTDALNGFMIQLQKMTYANLGGACIQALVMGVMLIAVCIMFVKVAAIVITRMAEIYILCAFSGFPIVMLADDKLRHSGIAYFKEFAAVCLQAGIIVVIVSFTGIFVSAATQLIHSDGGDMFAAFVNGLGMLAAIFAVTSLVSESRAIATKILGATS